MPSRNQESGTSLVELMLGAAIVITLLLAISTSVVSQTRLRRLSEERNLAMVACRNTLESMRDVTFATLPSLNGNGFDIPGNNGGAGGLSPVAGDADGLPGRITVTVDQSSGSEKLYLITLRVDWTGINGTQHFEMKSLMAERKA
jgi:type II secretory pathway pseudopilin PulG